MGQKLGDGAVGSSRERFGVLEALDDLIIVVGPDWRVLYLNGAARRFFVETSARSDEALGRPWTELVHWEDAAGAFDELRRGVERVGRWHGELVVRDPDGGRRYMECRVRRLDEGDRGLDGRERGLDEGDRGLDGRERGLDEGDRGLDGRERGLDERVDERADERVDERADPRDDERVDEPEGGASGAGAICSFREVGELQQTRQALREAREELRFQAMLLDRIHDRVTATDLEGRITYVNDAECETFGVDREALLGQSVRVYGEDPERGATQEEILRTALAQGSWCGEVVNLPQGGEPVVFESHVQLIHDEEGRPSGLVGISRDITDRKEREAALRRSEENYRRLTENAPDLIWRTDRAGRVLFVNQAVERLFDVSVEQARGLALGEYFTAESAARITAQVEKDLRAETPRAGFRGEFDYRLAGGERIPCEISAVYLWDEQGRYAGLEGIARDLRYRKRIEREHHENRRLLDAAISQSPIGIVIADAPDGRIRLANPAALAVTGDPEGPFVGLDIEQFIAQWRPRRPDGTPYRPDESPLSRALERGEVVAGEPLVFDDVHGQPRWLVCHAAPIRDQGGEITSCVVLFNDITAQKDAERALRTRDAVVEESLDGVVVTGMDGRITYTNKAFRAMYGYEPDEALGRPVAHLNADPELFEQVGAALRSGGNWTGEAPQRRRDGTIFEALLSMFVLRDETGRPTQAVCFIKDIQERHQLEAQLRQSQKMEALGRLAGGVAHDFNNLLTGITGYAELTLAALERDDPLREDVEEIHRAGERAASLTSQLLAFSRKQIISPKVVSPDALIRRSKRMLERIIGEDIELVFEPGGDTGRIKIEPNQLDQILVNLAVNARDAMPDGGRLTIETRTEEGPAAGEVPASPPAGGAAAGAEGEDIGAGRRGTSSSVPGREPRGEAEATAAGEAEAQGSYDAEAQGSYDAEARGSYDAEAQGSYDAEAQGSYDAEARGSYDAEAQGSYVVIRVRDEGEGMAPEVREQIFEPFFSTKDRERSTGLGLATVYGIVKQNGGDIHVDSAPGQGTVFEVRLPRVDEAPEPPEEPTASLARGRGTVLLVEDEEMVRHLAMRILRRHGYHVIEACHAEDALARCEDCVDDIDLVLTDVIMPGINGKELYERLREHRSDLAVLYMSGYSEQVLTPHGVLHEDTPFLAKPFSMDALLRRVGEVLESRGNPKQGPGGEH
jgi:PAS domain S-box-containing protein